MAGNDKPQPNIEQVRELLSPYLDDEVSGEERALVEEALAVSDELQADLDTLRQTVSLLQALPPAPAPRPFTLSEADVGVPARPAGGRGFFGLPAWLAGLAAAAATLVCVLAIGGLFVTGQIGTVSAPSELARLNQPVQTESEPVEAPAAEADAASQEAAPAEPPAPEENLAAEPAGEEAAVEATEPAVSQTEAQAVEAEVMEEAEEPVGNEAVEDTLSAEGEAVAVAEAEEPVAEEAVEEAAEAKQDQAEAAGELYRDDEAGAAAAEAAPLSAPTPTPAPLSTLEQPALAQEAVPADDQRDEPAAEAESLAPAPAPPAAAEAAPAENLAERGIAPRQVEIRDQNLSIRPGLIRLEGVIEVEPGAQLQATLLRNGAPVESWAASPVEQTVVEPGGRFTLEFEASAGSADGDLFGIEPANYQIVISSVGLDEPVTATVFFDTFGPAPVATVEPPSPTPTPSASPTTPATPTAVAKVELTFEPSPSPSPVVTPMEAPVLTTPIVAPTQTGPIRSVTLIVVVVLLGVGMIVVAGLLLWWLLKKQQR